MQDLTLGQAQIFESGGRISSIQWSPDGTNILIHNDVEAFLMPSNGRERRTLGEIGFIGWSPDGLQIVSSFARDSAPLVVTDVRTLATQPGSKLTLPGTLWKLVFGWPAADRILIFALMRSHGYAIWVARPDGTNARKIYQDDRSTQALKPIWVAAGRAIYYQRLRDQNTEIVRLALDDVGNVSDERVVFSPPGFSPPGFDAGFSISDDEQSLVYTRATESSTVTVTSHGRRMVLFADTRTKRGLSVSPDGQTIAFIASVGERGQIIVVPRDGSGTPRTLPMTEGRPLALAWSPHRDRLAYTVATTAGVQLWTIELATGAERQVSTSVLSETGAIAWTARDELLFQMAGNRNYGVLAPGKPERALVADDTVGWIITIQPSPDGHRVAVYWRRSASGVWLISLDDGTATQISTGDTVPVGWSDDGAWVFTVDVAAKSSGSVLAVDAAGKGVSRVILEGPSPNGELTMLPGEDGFAAIEVSRRSDLWLASLDGRRIDVSSAPLPPAKSAVQTTSPNEP